MSDLVAQVDFVKFAELVHRALDGVSIRSAASRLPGLNAGMLSRAINGKQLSVASYLAICKAFDLDPWEAFSLRPARPGARASSVSEIVKRMERNQAVTACVARETEAAR